MFPADGREDDMESEDSQDAWNQEEDYDSSHVVDPDKEQCLIECEEFKALKQRLLDVEKSIERRYLLHRYYAGLTFFSFLLYVLSFDFQLYSADVKLK